jgi:LysR family transcriptional activator of nhaA
MARLNFHHLHYFWAVAKEGHLTRAAAALHVSQSALSTQIRQLEAQLGQTLFLREGRSLQLTEAGRLALAYAETIFASGNELVALLRDGQQREQQVLRIGAMATLSRNFQENLLQPLLHRSDVSLVLQSGSLNDLLQRLALHKLDVVLTNRLVHSSPEQAWHCRRIASQPVSLVGQPRPFGQPFRFPEDLASVALVLPSRDNDIRAAFDLFCEQRGIHYRLRAEVDDMALLRLLARDSPSVALLPSVVVQDELRSGRLEEYCVVPDLVETFYAVTVPRHFEPPLLKTLLERSEAEALGRQAIQVGRLAVVAVESPREGPTA